MVDPLAWLADFYAHNESDWVSPTAESPSLGAWQYSAIALEPFRRGTPTQFREWHFTKLIERQRLRKNRRHWNRGG